MREEGYYWVRRKADWQVALWAYGSWWLVGINWCLDESNFAEIGCRIVKDQ